MRTSGLGSSCRPSSFAVVKSCRWAAVFVALAGVMIVGARDTASAQRAELAEPVVKETVAGIPPDVLRPANGPPPQMVQAANIPEAPAFDDIEAVATRSAASSAFVPSPVGGSIWVAQGPTAIEFGQVENIPPTNNVVGAAHTVAAHPTDPNILYLGAVNGGVWKTTNATAANPTWTPLTDFASSLSIGALEFDPTDATNNTLVAGIGRFSSFGRAGGPRTGLLRTTDGGSSWTALDGGGILVNKNISGVVARGSTIVVSVDFSEPFTFGNIGIFRSTDTGATFSHISGAGGSGLPLGRVFDLVGDPTAAAVLYTSVRDAGTSNGIYQSTDTGATWTRVSNATMNALIIDVAPFTSNVEMAVGNSNNVYAGIVNGGRLAGLFRSGNGGINWTSMDLPMTAEVGGNAGLHPGGQGGTHFSMLADPTNPSIVYLGGDRQPAGFNDCCGFPNAIGAFNFTGRLFRCDISAAPGAQCVHLTHSNSSGPAGGGTASSSAPHADSREMVFDANGDLIEVDDGGIYVRTSPQSNAGNWLSIIGSQCTEFHDIAYDTISDIIIGGTQDTGSVQSSPLPGLSWDTVNQGDGGDVAVDVISAAPNSIRYASAQFLIGFQRITRNASNGFVAATFPALVTVGGGTPLVTGGSGNVEFVAPIELNAINPTRLIIGGAFSTYESLNKGDTVREAGPGIRVNTRDAVSYGGRKGGVDNVDVLYVGSGNDVFVRTSAAPAPLVSTAYPSLFPTDIVLDPDDWMVAYVVDGSRKVFRTTDAGTIWTNITGNLTGVGILRSIEFVPGGDDVVAVGADAGVFISRTSALGTWNELGTNLPNAPAYDLDYDPADDVLVVGTLGRGAWLANGPFIPGGQPLTAPFPHDRRKNRYISFDPNKAENDGTNVAFKVELTAITLGSCNGTAGDPPQVDFCRTDRGADDCNTCAGAPAENACINQPIDCVSGTCMATGETCVNDAPNSGGSNIGTVWWVGPEQNGVHLLVSQSFRKESTNWPSPVHVGDCEIVPQAAYGVRAVQVTSGAESAQLVVETTLFAPLSASWWGDCVGPLKKFCGGDIRLPNCTGDADCTAPDTCDRAWTLPDGSVNFDDVNAALALVAPGPTSVAPDITWVDVHGNASGTPGSQNFDPPNFVLNFSDIGQILSGFGGFPYKGYDPADCPDTSMWP